jgi:putative ABC transport system permease protein
VVGVVSDRVPTGFGGGFQPKYALYLSVLQHPGRTLDLLVRARSARDLTDAVGGIAARRMTESQVVAAEVAPIRWFGRLFASEGWVMLLIATAGTFVVMRLWVTARFHELGVRRAVGARRWHVFAFIGARAMGVSLSGLALGLWFGGLSWGALPLVIPGLPPWDSHLVLRLAALLVGAALAGAFWPASWSTRVAPVALLRREGV